LKSGGFVIVGKLAQYALEISAHNLSFVHVSQRYQMSVSKFEPHYFRLSVTSFDFCGFIRCSCGQRRQFYFTRWTRGFVGCGGQVIIWFLNLNCMFIPVDNENVQIVNVVKFVYSCDND
jgi:hypothetical protein